MIKSYKLLHKSYLIILNIYSFYVTFSDFSASFQFKWDFSAHLTSEFELACFCVNLQRFLFSIAYFSHTRTVLTVLFFQKGTSVFKQECVWLCTLKWSSDFSCDRVSLQSSRKCHQPFVCVHFLCCACEQSIIAPWFPMTCFNIKYKPLWIIKQVRMKCNIITEIKGKS